MQIAIAFSLWTNKTYEYAHCAMLGG